MCHFVTVLIDGIGHTFLTNESGFAEPFGWLQYVVLCRLAEKLSTLVLIGLGTIWRIYE